MIKIFLIMLAFFMSLNILNAEDSEFIKQQELLLTVKTIIQEEESIARAYESFIITEKKIPETFSDLVSDEYLGSGFMLTPFVVGDTVSINDFGFRKGINNRFKDANFDGISSDDKLSVQRLYESDLFRKKTYFYDSDTIGIKLDDEFANHLYFLSSTAGFNLVDCADTPKKRYCTDRDDIYIYDNDSRTNLLMYYSIDKFKTGPIIITKETSFHITSDEFNSIPKGATLYDTNAVKYIKTISSIEVVK